MKLDAKNTLKSLAKRLPFVVPMYRSVRDGWLREPHMTPMGFRLNGNAAMQTGHFEPRESEIFKQLIKSKEVLINVGAFSTNVRYLLRNIAANGYEDHTEVFQLALTDKVGIKRMYGEGTGASLVRGWAGFSSNKFTFVPTSTLDIILGERMKGKQALILIDVEGAEYDVLKGSRSLLVSKPKPVWMVEIESRSHQPKGVVFNPNFVSTFELFLENGYQAYSIGERLGHLNENHIQAIAETEKWLSSSNFIFADNLAI